MYQTWRLRPSDTNWNPVWCQSSAADAALDAGDEELARGLVWLARWQRQPLLNSGYGIFPVQWVWFGLDDSPDRLPEGKTWRDYAHHLPYDVFRRIGGPQKTIRTSTSFPKAIIAAARAAGKEMGP